MRKVCTFCGLKTDGKVQTCSSCGSHSFHYICPNCSNEFEGQYCNNCGVRFDAEPKVCRGCGTKFYTASCPNCDYINSQNTNNPSPVQNYNIAGQSNIRSPGFVALVLSIVGLFVASPIFSIIAICLTAKDVKNGTGDRYSKPAYICGIVGTVIGVFIFLFYLIMIIFSQFHR